MLCQKCKSVIPEESVYCPVCQCPTGIVPPEGASRICPRCGSTVGEGLLFCTSCGYGMNPSSQCPDGVRDDTTHPSTQQTEVRQAPKRKKANKPVIIMAAIAVLMVAVLVAGLLTNWFGLTGPKNRISSAAKKTFGAERFTVDISMKMKRERYDGDIRTEKIDGTAQVLFDPDNRKLTVYAELESGDDWAVLAVYDGFYINQTESGCYKMDISEELGEFFDAYEEGTSRDFSWEDFLNQVFGEDTYEDAAEDIDFDALGDCWKKYERNLNNNGWLEKNAGYSVEREEGVTRHCFAPDLYHFLDVTTDAFSEVFVDEEDFQDWKDSLRESKREIRETDAELVFGIKGGKLVQLELELSSGGTALSCDFDFQDIGKADIDEDDLESLFQKAETI